MKKQTPTSVRSVLAANALQVELTNRGFVKPFKIDQFFHEKFFLLPVGGRENLGKDP